MVGSLALFAGLVTLGNLIDYETNCSATGGGSRALTIKAMRKMRSALCVSALGLLTCCLVSYAARAQTVEPIKIGAVLPFSGGVELYGRQAKLGLDLAAKQINNGGGILGCPLEIIYEDDKTRPDPADKAARKLIEQDGVLALIGPITSQNLNAIAPTVEAIKTPLLYATNYEGD